MRLYLTMSRNMNVHHNMVKSLPRICSPNFRNFNSSVERAAVPGTGLVKGKKGPVIEKIKLPVETDPEKLVSCCCGADYRKENPQDPEIKPDSEYPDWLWTVRMGKAPPLEDMEPTTKAYWRRTKDYYRRYHLQLKKLRRF